MLWHIKPEDDDAVDGQNIWVIVRKVVILSSKHRPEQVRTPQYDKSTKPHMKAIYAILSLLLPLSLAAEQVESTAGTLKGKIRSTDITTLSLTGTIDASDIDYINDSLRLLKTLDLADVSIRSYNGKRLANGRNYSPDNTLPEFCLLGSQIETIILPKGLKCMADGCLSASSITRIDIPESVDSIGTGACNNCISLTEVILPASVRYLPSQIFKGCRSLTVIKLPQTVEKLCYESFMGCTSLTEIRFPDALSIIEDRVFSGCKNLSDICFTSSIQTIGEEAFTGTGLTIADMTACRSLNTLGDWAFSHCDNLGTAILPENLTTLGDGLFFDCNSLTAIAMPSGITRLANYMLKGSGLSDAEQAIGPEIKEIGDYTLYGNDKITTLKLNKAINKLGDKALAMLSALKTLDVTEIEELPELGQNVFEGTAGPDIILSTAAMMVPVFKATPQWQDFDIKSEGSADAITPEAGITGRLTNRIDGKILWINAPCAMKAITVSDLQGHITVRQAINGDTTACIPTDNIPHGVAILTVQFDNTTFTNIKIIL